MVVSRLLSVAATIEAATGVALIIFPEAVAKLLLGASLSSAETALARVAGIALLSFGLVCWISRQYTNKAASLAAMLTYNSLVAAYLAFIGFGGELVGILLWPAIAAHAILALMFAHAWLNREPAHPG